jgi:hypothetical protein
MARHTVRIYSLLVATGLASGCTASDSDPQSTEPDDGTVAGSGSGGGEGSTLTSCAPRGIRPPVDESPNYNSLSCLRASFTKIKAFLPEDAQDGLDELDGSVLFTSDCIDVSTPRGMTFVTGLAIERDDTGTDVSRQLKIPLPSSVEIAEATGISERLISLPDVDLPTNLAVFVAKVTEFKGEKLFKLVNLATVHDEAGQRFLQIGIDVDETPAPARSLGAGIYGLFVSQVPMGLVSGTVTLDGTPTGDAIVVGTEAPFLSVADDDGRFVIANVAGQAGLAGYHLPTGGRGELLFPLQLPGEVNPKTGEPAEIPGEAAPLPGVDTLSLRGLTLAMSSAEPPLAATNLDFESGDFSEWLSGGNAAVLDAATAQLFPDTRESFYAFLSTGAGALGGVASYLVRDFDIPAGRTKLKVEYNFVSQEYPSWVDTEFNDSFYILIGGDKVFLHKESVNNNAGKWKDFYTALGNVGESEASVTDVLHLFGGETGRREAEFDVARCSGQRTRLIFGVSDMGDSIYDTAALINRIWFE